MVVDMQTISDMQMRNKTNMSRIAKIMGYCRFLPKHATSDYYQVDYRWAHEATHI